MNRVNYPRDETKDDINVLALVKGDERYVFYFADTERAAVLRCFGMFASRPDLSFTWYDAAVLSQKVRKDTEGVTDDGT